LPISWKHYSANKTFESPLCEFSGQSAFFGPQGPEALLQKSYEIDAIKNENPRGKQSGRDLVGGAVTKSAGRYRPVGMN
jgi:hypothetical protein